MTEPGRTAVGPHGPVAGQPMLEVYDLRRTCIASPSQWEGRVNDQGSIYIRYRWGTLRVYASMSDTNAVAAEAPCHEDDIGERTGDRLGGYMDTDDMRRALSSMCNFHGECDEEHWQSHP